MGFDGVLWYLQRPPDQGCGMGMCRPQDALLLLLLLQGFIAVVAVVDASPLAMFHAGTY